MSGNGSVQVLVNNNAADKSHLQTATSAEWKAIDATSGEFITPNGSGTTENSVKMDFVSSKCCYTTTPTTISDTSRYSPFGSAYCDSTISDSAKSVLYALALLPYDSTASKYESDAFYFNNGAAERSFYCGGCWSNGSYAGVFALDGNTSRSSSNIDIGFRSAYVELPTA